jgi:hypothetical protein
LGLPVEVCVGDDVAVAIFGVGEKNVGRETIERMETREKGGCGRKRER